MRVCDRCLDQKSSRIEVVFDKEDASKKSNRRRMLSVKMDLCESCITEFLKAFGHFKVRFMKEGDEPDEKPNRSDTADAR